MMILAPAGSSAFRALASPVGRSQASWWPSAYCTNASQLSRGEMDGARSWMTVGPTTVGGSTAGLGACPLAGVGDLVGPAGTGVWPTRRAPGPGVGALTSRGGGREARAAAPPTVLPTASAASVTSTSGALAVSALVTGSATTTPCSVTAVVPPASFSATQCTTARTPVPVGPPVAVPVVADPASSAIASGSTQPLRVSTTKPGTTTVDSPFAWAQER